MNHKTSHLVYSTDPELNRKCSKCKEVVSECVCEPEVDPKKYKFIAILRIEKNGRGGTYLTSGIDGVIDIQGDHRDAIRGLLEKEWIKSK